MNSMSVNQLAMSGLGQRMEDGWYEESNTLKAPNGDVGYVNADGRVFSIKSYGQSKYSGVTLAYTLAKESFSFELARNTNIELLKRNCREASKEDNGIKLYKETLKMLNNLQLKNEEAVKAYRGSSQDLGEPVTTTRLNRIAKLKLTKDGDLDQKRTELAQHTLSNLFQYGFLRFAVENEFEDKMNDYTLGFGDVLAYQTKDDNGSLELNFITADRFLKTLFEPKVFDTAECYSFMHGNLSQKKCIAWLESKGDKAVPGKAVVKFV